MDNNININYNLLEIYDTRNNLLLDNIKITTKFSIVRGNKIIINKKLYTIVDSYYNIDLADKDNKNNITDNGIVTLNNIKYKVIVREYNNEYLSKEYLS